MRVALLSDIHGNLPALEAVLEALPPVAALICAGDLVGYYPDANEVCSRLQERHVITVRGNHDAYVCGALQPDPTRERAYRTDWTRRQLEAKHRDWLAALPVEMNFSFGGFVLRVRHASPWDETTYLYENSLRLKDIRLAAGEFLMVGHTHRPLLVPAGEGLLLNPGSVGQSRDGQPEANYALLDTDTGDVRFCRASYDVSGFQSRLRSLAWPEESIDILAKTR